MNPRLIISAISALCLVSTSLALKCYTCGEQEGESTSCANFQSADSPGFATDCGKSGKSCRMARKVNQNLILSRGCETIDLEDCKTANSIEFCYCTKDLCNKINPADDEEDQEEDKHPGYRFVEGSGMTNEMPTAAPNPNKSNQDFAIEDSEEVNERANNKENFESNRIASSCSVHQVRWHFLSTTVMNFCLFSYYRVHR